MSRKVRRRIAGRIRVAEMKKHPAGDFSDILAGLTGDRGKPGHGQAQRAASPAADMPAVRDWKANAAARKPKAPAATKKDRDEEKRASPDIERGEENIEIRPRRVLKRLLAALFWPGPFRAPRPRRPERENFKSAAAAAQAKTEEEAPAGAAPADRPGFRLPRLFKVKPWASHNGVAFPKIKFHSEESPKPGGVNRAAAARRPASAAAQIGRPKTEDEAIAAEMGLHADLATADLRKIRREFAKKNHPDRFEAPQRMSAARRMSIANMLIDEHLKKKPPAK